VRILNEYYLVPCPFTGVMFFFFIFVVTAAADATIAAVADDDDEDDDENDEVFSGEGNYFRIADFIGIKLTFVITDAT
jgi:hypothetical protein